MAKIKIGVWVLSDYNPQTGGGFSLYDKIIQLIDGYKFSNEIEICFVGQNPKSKYNFKKEYACVNPISFFGQSYITGLISKYSHKIKLLNSLECKILRKNNIDLIYYPVQGFKKINNFPFAVANWDIGHKSNFAFPEVAMNNRFEYREKWYAKEIHKALMVFAESEAGKEELITFTKLNPDRIGIVPLFPGGVVDIEVSETEQKKFLAKNNLISEKFFFYPAQFWAHKNHYNLLVAFKGIISEFSDLKLVFSGADKGNKKYIIDVVKEYGLSNNVLFTGFIRNEDIFTLYKNALALVMPSFSGTTNMPLLEARKLNCPVLCSDLKGHMEIMKDSAFYFRPEDSESILTAMKKILDGNERGNLLIKADKSLQETFFSEQKALIALDENFHKLKSIRLCWGKEDKIF